MKFEKFAAALATVAVMGTAQANGMLQIGLSESSYVLPGSNVVINAVWRNSGTDAIGFSDTFDGLLPDGSYIGFSMGYGMIWDPRYSDPTYKNLFDYGFQWSFDYTSTTPFDSLRGIALAPGETRQFVVASFNAPQTLEITTLNHLVVGIDCWSGPANQLCDVSPLSFTTANMAMDGPLKYYDVASISPVPAPPAFILMLTGLGLLGLTKRFRKEA